jgi:hypothetical protein
VELETGELLRGVQENQVLLWFVFAIPSQQLVAQEPATPNSGLPSDIRSRTTPFEAAPRRR